MNNPPPNELLNELHHQLTTTLKQKGHQFGYGHNQHTHTISIYHHPNNIYIYLDDQIHIDTDPFTPNTIIYYSDPDLQTKIIQTITNIINQK